MEHNTEASSSHGVTVEGQNACCRKGSNGLVDCLCCLEEKLSTFLNGLDPEDGLLVQRVLMIVRETKTKGISKDQLFVCL
jgi:hypothetical protein